MKTLITIDMQHDFIYGSLGNPDGVKIIPAVREKILKHDGPLIFTKDIHYQDYFEHLEAQAVPMAHCINGTAGAEIVEELADLTSLGIVLQKSQYGYDGWGDFIIYDQIFSKTEEIEICGVCTDICVISNALMLRSLYPEIPITVDASCCAGLTPEKHKAALEVMKSCNINVKE
jgi:nicotinamidase-related amidase